MTAPPATWGRAQSAPKRSGTNCLQAVSRGTNGHVRRHTTCVTSTWACTDNAEADGSIPSSPTKDLVNGYFSNGFELST